jgi:hypothetical protein
VSLSGIRENVQELTPCLFVGDIFLTAVSEVWLKNCVFVGVMRGCIFYPIRFVPTVFEGRFFINGIQIW